MPIQKSDIMTPLFSRYAVKITADVYLVARAGRQRWSGLDTVICWDDGHLLAQFMTLKFGLERQEEPFGLR